MSEISEQERLLAAARALATSVKKMLQDKASLSFSARPIFEKKPITQFASAMRVDAMEKFNSSTACSWVSLYLNEEKMEENDPVGVVVCYLERDFIDDMMEILDYPFEDGDEDYILQGCGAVCNLVSGYFVKELTLLGFEHLQMSHFTSFINTVPNGVKYPLEETQKFETSYFIQGRKKIVTDLVLTDIPLQR